jgi:hypothetical protein
VSFAADLNKKRNGLPKPFRSIFSRRELSEESVMKITSRVCHDKHCGGIDSIFWQVGVVPGCSDNRRCCNNDRLCGSDGRAAAPVAGIPAGKFSSCAGSGDTRCFASTNRGFANYDRDSFAGHSLKLRKCSLKKRLPPKPSRAVSNNS